MQDRIARIDENLLHRTAGPYIRVKIDGLAMTESSAFLPGGPLTPEAASEWP